MAQRMKEQMLTMTFGTS